MNRATLRQVGSIAGYLIVPLIIASLIYLITYRRFDLPIIVALIALAVCVVAFTATNPQAVVRMLGARLFRSWIISAITILAVLGILVLVNVLVARVPAQLDNTASKSFTVNDQTVKAIEKIQNPVKVSIFFTDQTAGLKDQAIEQLKAYQSRTDKISVETFDINGGTGLGKARELNVNTDPLVVFQSNNRREDATSIDEQSFTRAILRLQQTVQKRVFFTSTHGERSTTFGTQTGQEGMSEAVTALTTNNYTVETINLSNNTDSKGKVVTLNPSTDVIIVAAPTAPFQQQEKERLVGFLRQGGRAMFLQDPTNFLSTQTKNDVNSMLAEWNGLKFDDGLVVETNPQAVAADDPRVLLPTIAKENEIAQGINFVVIMAFAGGVSPGGNQQGFSPILTSSPASYLKANVEQIRGNQYGYVQGSDKAGPITLAASFETDAKEATPSSLVVPGGADTRKTRIALFSSIAWATDIGQGFGISRSPGNYNLFINTVNWLVQEKDAVVIAPKTPDTKPFVINQSQDTFIFYSTFIGLPLVVFIIGIVVWWRRR